MLLKRLKAQIKTVKFTTMVQPRSKDYLPTSEKVCPSR